MENLKFTIEDFRALPYDEISVSIIFPNGFEMTLVIQKNEFWKWVEDNGINQEEVIAPTKQYYDHRDPDCPWVTRTYDEDEFFGMVPEMNQALIDFLSQKIFQPLINIMQPETELVQN
jgi:hypothetical protein